MIKQLFFSTTTLLALMIVFSTHAQIPNYLPTDGLVAWYPFNGNANDESGNGINGSVNGASLTQDRFGNQASAYEFDGVSDFIIAELNPGSELNNLQQGTLVFWFKGTDASGSNAVISIGDTEGYDEKAFTRLYHSGNQGQQYAVYWGHIQDETIGGGFDYITNLQMGSSSGEYLDIFDNQWHFVAIVTGDGNNRIIIDGFTVDVSFAPGNSNTAGFFSNVDKADALFIGAEWNAGGNETDRHFTGALDDIAVFSTALSDFEINQLFESSPQPCAPCLDNYAQGDLDCNGAIDVGDLLIFLSNYGTVIGG